jgi:SP family general alpha glucoside:H+ symporter-like MFS transporter
MGYSTYFYQQAGLPSSNSFTLSMCLYIIGAVGTILSWPLMSRFGRRKIYVSGLGGMGIVLFIIGCLGIFSKSPTPAQWAVGSLLLVYAFVYDLTVGPICYSLVSELSSTRLRSKTIVLARICYTVSGMVTNTLVTRMLNPSAWGWGAKLGYFWAGSCLVCFVWAFFRLPEPKGRTYVELDILFARGVSARKFSSTTVEPFETPSDSPSEKKEAEQTTVEKIERV